MRNLKKIKSLNPHPQTQASQMQDIQPTPTGSLSAAAYTYAVAVRLNSVTHVPIVTCSRYKNLCCYNWSDTRLVCVINPSAHPVYRRGQKPQPAGGWRELGHDFNLRLNFLWLHQDKAGRASNQTEGAWVAI